MSRLAMAMAATVLVAGIYTTVEACDESRKAEVRRTLSSTQTTVITVGSVDIQVPKTALDAADLKDLNQCYVFVATANHDGPATRVIGAAKKARTLGRALVTTVEAVMGAIAHAAVEKTAAAV